MYYWRSLPLFLHCFALAVAVSVLQYHSNTQRVSDLERVFEAVGRRLVVSVCRLFSFLTE